MPDFEWTEYFRSILCSSTVLEKKDLVSKQADVHEIYGTPAWLSACASKGLIMNAYKKHTHKKAACVRAMNGQSSLNWRGTNARDNSH